MAANGEQRGCNVQRKIQREEFRKYLEAHGVTDAFTQALFGLYTGTSLPEDPINYIVCFLSEKKQPETDVSSLRNQLKEQDEKLKIQLKKMKELEQRLSKYEEVELCEEMQELSVKDTSSPN